MLARVLAVALWLGSIACGSPTDKTAEPTDLEGLTARLVELDRAYWASGRDPSVARELTTVAQRRALHWDYVVRTQPRRALASVVPLEISVELPAATAPYVERPFEHAAPVSSSVGDDLETHSATYELRFIDLEQAELFLAPDVARPRHGERFSVRGFRHDDVVLVETGEGEPHAVDTTRWEASEKVLLVKLSYANKSLSITTAQLTTAIASASSYFSTISKGTTSLSGTVVGPYTTDIEATCSFDSIHEAMRRALAANGVETKTFHQLVAVVPDNACGYTGKSQVGQVTTGGATFSIINDPSALTNELGRAHGVNHAPPDRTADLDDESSRARRAGRGRRRWQR